MSSGAASTDEGRSTRVERTNGGHEDRGFAAVEDAVAAIGRGEIVVVVDDENRENEGDLIMAAEKVTTDHVAFFLHHTSGFLCTAITEERARELRLDPMVVDNTESMKTAFLVSVDYRIGTTTGISASDRAATIRALADPETAASDLARPGHVLPLEARTGGVLKRAGHTEATVDLVSMAGLTPAGLLCEIVTGDKSEMARVDELRSFADEHGLLMITIADLIRHRRRTEKLVTRVSTAQIPTEWGLFSCHAFQSTLDGIEHLAFTMGDVRSLDGDSVLVRVHSECLTGDVFGSRRCDCGPQLNEAMRLVAAEGRGAVVYLRGHEGRGIGLGHKLRAYALQEQGRDTVDANLELGLPVDSREYGVGAQILVDLGITKMRVLTNNPSKYGGLAGFGLEIVGRVPLMSTPTRENLAYLRTKRERMGHLIGLRDLEPVEPGETVEPGDAAAES
jgi:3,4-dihydroxy 2-butanone 4-phosphate synthase/GTP cyclohydrolase II